MDSLYKSTKINDEINRILSFKEDINENSNSLPLSLNPNIISIYDVCPIILKKAFDLENLEKTLDKHINSIISNHFSGDSRIVFHGMNFDTNELSISFKRYWSWSMDNYDMIVFSKKYNNLYIVKTETYLYKDEIFDLLKVVLSDGYDELIKFKDSQVQSSYYIKCFNSDFRVSIRKYGVTLSDDNIFRANFELDRLHYKDTYTCECKYDFVLNSVKGNEEEIFKKIFVNIEDCPNWMKEQLYEIRKKQIDEILNPPIEKKEEINLEKNEKQKSNFKQKILSLFRK